MLAHLRQPRPQLGIADFDRQHRVLQLGDRLIGVMRVIDPSLDQRLTDCDWAPGVCGSNVRTDSPDRAANSV